MKPETQSLGAVLSLAAALIFSTSAQAALVVPAGNPLVVNDTDLNITWTQDANLFQTMAASNANLINDVLAAAPHLTISGVSTPVTYDTPNAYDTPADSGHYNLTAGDFNTGTGQMNWWGAQAWVNYLNSTSYAGQTGWRLPTTNPAVSGYNQTGSELGHLFYTELGGTAGSSIVTVHANTANYNLFSNIQSSVYWSGTEYAQIGRASCRERV